MPDNKPQAYTSTATTTAPEELLYPAGKQPTALTTQDVNAEAQSLVELEANMRVAREAKAPVVLPDLPPGLSPSEKVALISGSGSRAVTYPPKSPEAGEHPPQQEQAHDSTATGSTGSTDTTGSTDSVDS